METLECSLERGGHPGMTVLASSLTEPVTWNCSEYVPGKGMLITQQTDRDAVASLLAGVTQQSAVVWNQPQLLVLLVAPGHGTGK